MSRNAKLLPSGPGQSSGGSRGSGGGGGEGKSGGIRQQLQESSSDLPVELENQIIIRMPLEPAKVLREALKSGTMSVKERLNIQMEPDMRHGKVFFDNWTLHGKVVDLPTLVESLKTIDSKSFYKTADVCQMLVCKEEEDDPATTDDEITTKTKKKDPNKVDKKFLLPHGITPPMKNVRKRRFRKTLKKKYTDAPEIEKEVKRLLRVDNDATRVRWEVIDEEDEKSKDSMGGGGGGGALKEGEVTMEFSTPMSMEAVAEHDIFGEVLSDSEEEESKINIMELEDNSRFSGDDSRMSDSHIASLMRLQQRSSEPKKPLVTHFTQEMFQEKSIFEKPSSGSRGGASSGAGSSGPGTAGTSSTPSTSAGSKDPGFHILTIPKQEVLDEEEMILAAKRDEFLKDPLDFALSIQPSKAEIMARLQILRQELGELRLRRTQQEAEVAGIENLALQQRFQGILNNLIEEQAEKEREYEELLALTQ